MVVGFWGVEVKAGVPLRVKADKENGVKISQATLSEVENKGGNESIHLVLNVNDQKFVIGTLIPEEISQIFYDLFLDRDFELSHNGKNESIYFCGYRPTSFVESDDDTDSDIGELPLIFKENGEPEQTEEKPILTTEKAAAKSKVTIVKPKKDDESESQEEKPNLTTEKATARSKVTIVKPKKGDNTNEDDEEDSDEDDESESQEEKPNLTTEKATARSKVTIVKPKKGDNTNGDSDEDSDKDSDEDDESESQEEKPNLTTEKAAARSKVTIVEPKKGDNTNEDDDEDSDEYSDDEAKSQEEVCSFLH
ncbi:Histone deacetylase hdt1 [Thalictrum thalictroides]|uniref:Histone deacetylase hdt1 n=1 Tax=Thalictrum thalictroides TaxID=46969 RepID=A0A7J6WEM0_THATH|nr:Histone deacetylase hdt1 [Thalictrum thalictroides]